MFRITEIFLDNCGQHSLWGTAGRKIRDKFFILIGDKFNPCRTTGCQKRKFFSFFNTIQEFSTFFHDCKVGTEACVIYFIKSHAVQGIYNLAHYAAALLQAIVITDCNTNCRCDLSNHTYIRICQIFPYLIGICTDRNCTGRTEYTALTTVYTLCLGDFFVECRHNHCFCSTESKSKCSDSLNLFTDTYAVSAKDTFIRITYNRW